MSLREMWKIDSYGPNNDGCDPDSCTDVLIDSCSFSTGDDCIAIKAGRNHDGRRVAKPTENVIIRNCDMKDGHGGHHARAVKSPAGIRNVFIENCRLNSPNLNEAFRFKTNAMRWRYYRKRVFSRYHDQAKYRMRSCEVDFYYQEGPKDRSILKFATSIFAM